MRLGDLLLEKRRITAEQVQAALDGQGMYGGRLGTNLVRLGYLDVDTLARALGEQSGRPWAETKHIAAIGKHAVSLFSARVVTSYKAIPLGWTSTKPPRVIIACVDPATIPVDELAFAAGCRVDLWVAPELVIEEALERYFGVPRAASPYVEMKLGADAFGSEAPAVRPAAPPRAAPTFLEPPPSPQTFLEPSPPESTRRPARAPMVLEPPPLPEPSPRRRPSAPPVVPHTRLEPSPMPVRTAPTFLEPPPTPAPSRGPSAREELPSEDGWDLPDPPRAPTPPPPPPTRTSHHPMTAPPEALRPVIDQAEASRMLEMATSKDHVGRVLEDWLRSTFGCGLVLIVKSGMAVGWKGYFEDAEDLIEAIAVPLNKPSMFSHPHDSRLPFCGPPPEDGARLNGLLWKLLRCQPPAEVVVCPVVVGSRTVNLLYAHAEDGNPLSDTLFRQAQVVAGAAGAAYGRIIQRAKR